MRYLIRHTDWGWLLGDDVPAVWEWRGPRLGTRAEIRGHRRLRLRQRITMRDAMRFRTYKDAEAAIKTWPKYKDQASPRDRMEIVGVTK